MKWTWNRGRLANQAKMSGVLWVPVVVHDDVHVEVGGHALVDAVEELAELDGPVAAVRLGDDGAGLGCLATIK